MFTRQTRYLHTRSGKRYLQETTYSLPARKKQRHIRTLSPIKKLKRENHQEVTVTPTSEEKVTPDNEVVVKEINYEDWKTDIQNMLKETLHMTQEELEHYPFFKWFMNKTEQTHITNHIRRDFFRDEDEYYLKPFQSWQTEVDNLLYTNLGLNRLDIRDFPFYDHFHNMDTPLEMFQHMRRQLYL